MRIVVESHINYRAASSLAAAEQFEPHLPSLDGGSRGNTNPNVAETDFRRSRQTSHDESEGAARFSSELPASQTSFIRDVVSHKNGPDA